MQIPVAALASVTRAARLLLDQRIRYRVKDRTLSATVGKDNVFLEAQVKYVVVGDLDATVAATHALGLLEIAEGHETLDLVIDDRVLRAKVGRAAFAFPLEDEVPLVPDGTLGVQAVVTMPEGLQAALGQVLPAVGTDPTRLALTGVRVEPEAVAATDGHRLHHVRVVSGVPRGVTVPAAWAKAVCRVGGAGLLKIEPAADGRVFYTADKDGVFCRLMGYAVEGEYPDWRQFADSLSPWIEVPRAALLAALRGLSAMHARAEVVASAVDGSVGLRIDEGALLVGGSGTATTTTRAAECKLDPKFFDAALDAAGSETVRLGFGDQRISVSSPDEAFVAVVMGRR